jgi:hypothetical protein
MIAILTFLMLAGSPEPTTLGGSAIPAGLARAQEPTAPGSPETERLELRKDGGPGRGPDQPYNIREDGARDLERFIGGKQVVFIAPYDVFLLLLLIVVVVLIIAL